MDSFGRTPLLWARRNGNPQIVKLLFETAQMKGMLIRENVHFMMMDQVHDDGGLPWCDVCTLGIPKINAYYECGDCHGGDFDICLDCFKVGGRCLDDSHKLASK